jgi:moderate conductance mechanosensitive channel
VDPSAAVTELATWFKDHAAALIIAAIVLVIASRVAKPALHRLLVRIFRTQAADQGDDPSAVAEANKRVETIEDLLDRALRFFYIVVIVLVVFSIFDLWPLLAGLGVIVAAITLAGQSIVLDYLMGILILVEGQYFKGDTIVIESLEGKVEEVGIRRTLVRDNRGALHSISNGLIRRSTNLTRNYAVAMIHVEGIAEGDVEQAIEVLDRVGSEIYLDPEWAPRFLEAPRYTGTTALRAGGATLRLSGRIRPEFRVLVETEMRRRVAVALAAASIEPHRPAIGASPVV